MRQNPVGEPAATAAWNFGTPRRRSSWKRLRPFCHCRQRYERSLRRIHASRLASTRGVWQKPKYPRHPMRYGVRSSINRVKLIPRVRRVLSRICTLSFRRDAPLAPVVRDAEPQEFALLRSRHRALRHVDLQPQLGGQKPAHQRHHPFSGAAAANIDIRVVGIAAEAETPAGQFLVEIVKHEIAQEGRERTPLRGARIHRTDQTILHHPGLEKSPDEPEHAFIRQPRGNPRHQAVVVDSVEEFFEIKIDHDVVARGNVALRLGNSLVGGSPRSEAVTVLGEGWVPLLLENLQQGLLDQSVDDTRYAELSDPAIRLGYFDPLDRLRLVGSREQMRPDAWPVLTQVGLGVLDSHPIDARATLVTANSFPRSFEIFSVAHLLHQLFCAGWAFGCRGKLNRLRCTAAGSTLRALDGDGLRDTLPARPALAPRIRFLFIGSHLCSTLPSDPASRR